MGAAILQNRITDEQLKQIKDIIITFKKRLKTYPFNGYYSFGIVHQYDIYLILCIVYYVLMNDQTALFNIEKKVIITSTESVNSLKLQNNKRKHKQIIYFDLNSSEKYKMETTFGL